MTVVVGVVELERVYLGADSAVTAGDDVAVLARPKVRRRGGILLGACGDMSAVGAILDGLEVPRYDGGDLGAYMAQRFYPALRDCLRSLGRGHEAEVLVAAGGQLASIDHDGAIIVHARAYAAIGSGSAYALGACYHRRGHGRRLVRVAIEAAAEHCASVRAPVQVLSASAR